jgi:hypothetical protein
MPVSLAGPPQANYSATATNKEHQPNIVIELGEAAACGIPRPEYVKKLADVD